jgi:transglutaminase-like putative cysteine protease
VGASRTVELRYDVVIPEPRHEGDPIHVWLPLPPNTSHQEVLAIQSEASVPVEIRYDPIFGNAILHALADGTGTEPIRVSYRAIVKRTEWRVDLARPRFDTLAQDAQLLQPQLQESRKVRFLPEIRAAAEEIRAKHKDPLQIARAAYDYVLANMTYDKSGEGWGSGDTEWACSMGKGNCTDFHTLFLAVLRCSGVACEFEIGAAFPPGMQSGDITSYKCGYHCWTRFFIPGIGWVPADVSEAARNPEKRSYFFGAIDEDRVLLSCGRDIVMVPTGRGGPENFFTEPRIEKASGQAVTYEKRLEFANL